MTDQTDARASADTSADVARAGRDVPIWVPVVTLALAVVGLVIASYLTFQHYSTSVPLSCPETGTINCGKVLTSQYSTLHGVPVALLGLLYFVAAIPLCLPVAWRSPVQAIHLVRLGTSLVGVIFVCYLVWAELYRIDAICLYCTAVHITTFLLFCAIAIGTAFSSPASERV